MIHSVNVHQCHIRRRTLPVWVVLRPTLNNKLKFCQVLITYCTKLFLYTATREIHVPLSVYFPPVHKIILNITSTFVLIDTW